MPAIPSFDELATLEPRLAGLLAEARSYSDRHQEDFCASSVWYGRAGSSPGLLDRLLTLVSPDSGREGVLGSYLAFAVAYDTLTEALPRCQGPCVCGTKRPAVVRSRPAAVRWEIVGSTLVGLPGRWEALHEASSHPVPSGG